MKLKELLKSKKAVAMEWAIMFGLIVLATGTLLISTMLLANASTKEGETKQQQVNDLNQIGEYFVRSLEAGGNFPTGQETTLADFDSKYDEKGDVEADFSWMDTEAKEFFLSRSGGYLFDVDIVYDETRLIELYTKWGFYAKLSVMPTGADNSALNIIVREDIKYTEEEYFNGLLVKRSEPQATFTIVQWSIKDPIIQVEVEEEDEPTGLLGKLWKRLSNAIEETITNISEYLGLRAHYTSIYVIYDENYVKEDGTLGKSSFIRYVGDPLIMPDATRLGYTFDGWFKTPDTSDTVADTEDEIKDNYVGTVGRAYEPTVTTHLYAHWTKNDLTVHYCNGKTADGHPGNAFAATEPTEKKDGTNIRFAGWYTEQYGGHKVQTVDGVYYASKLNDEIWAHWGIAGEECTIVFHANGGMMSEDTIEAYAKDEVVRPAAAKSGYALLGWYLVDPKTSENPEDWGEEVFGEDGYYVVPEGKTRLDFYAAWKVVAYTITYLDTDDTQIDYSATAKTQQYYTGESFELKKYTGRIAADQHFAGWRVESVTDNDVDSWLPGALFGVDGTGAESLTVYQTDHVGGTDYVGNVILQAQVLPNIFEVALEAENNPDDSDGDISFFVKYGDGCYPTIECEEGYSINTVKVPAKRGYNFNGYYYNIGSTKYYIVDKDGNIDVAKARTLGVTRLTADWTPGIYTITLSDTQKNTERQIYIKFGVGIYSSSDCNSASKIDAISVDTYTGEEFKGYFSSPNGNGSVRISPTGAFNLGSTGTWNLETFSQDQVFYGYWERQTYQVAFNANGGAGTKMANQTRSIGDSAPLSTNTYTKDGYTFAGWNTNLYGTGKSVPDESIVDLIDYTTGGAVTLYAQWAPKTYTVTVKGANKAGIKVLDKNGNTVATYKSNNKYETSVSELGSFEVKCGETVYFATEFTYGGKKLTTSYTNSSNSTVTIDNCCQESSGSTLNPDPFAMAKYSFTMPAGNVTISVEGCSTYKTYELTVKRTNVNISADYSTYTFSISDFGNVKEEKSGVTDPSEANVLFDTDFVFTVTSDNGVYEAYTIDSAGKRTTLLPSNGKYKVHVTDDMTLYISGNAEYKASVVLAAATAKITVDGSTTSYSSNGSRQIYNGKTVKVTGLATNGVIYTIAVFNSDYTFTKTVQYKSELEFTMPGSDVTINVYGQAEHTLRWSGEGIKSLAVNGTTQSGTSNTSGLKVKIGDKVKLTVEDPVNITIYNGSSTKDSNNKLSSYPVKRLDDGLYEIEILDYDVYINTVTKNHHHITYDLTGGSWPYSGKGSAYGFSDEYVYVPNPVKTGYTFNGWLFTNLENTRKDKVVGLVDVKIEHFYADSAEGANEDSVEGKVIPEGTKSTYYKQLRYTNDNSGSNPAKLTAKWTPNIYTLTIDNNDGVGTITAIYEKYGTGFYSDNGCTAQITKVAVPVRTGYIFQGYFDTMGTQVVDGNGNIVVTNTKYSGGKTITAYWKVDKSTVTYNLAGGSGNIPNGEFTVMGTSFVVTSVVPTRAGYDFDGWIATTVQSGGVGFTQNKVYASGTRVVLDSATGNVVLTAKWVAHSYTVYFHRNDGGTDYMVSQLFNYGGTTELKDTNFTRDGYILTGWAKTATGSKAYDLDHADNTLATGNGATVDLYAVWTPKNYTVTYEYDNGSANTTGSYNVDKTSIAMPAAPSKTGYTFAGWKVLSPGGHSLAETENYFKTGNTYAAGASVTLTKAYGEVTLKAQWTRAVYALTIKSHKTIKCLNGNDGTTWGKIYVRYSDAFYWDAACTQKITLGAWEKLPSLTGYDMNGLSLTKDSKGNATTGTQKMFDGNGAMTENCSVTKFTKDTDLYIRWDSVIYRVKFVMNNGTTTGISSNFGNFTMPKPSDASGNPYDSDGYVKVYYNADLTVYEPAARTGYTFAGWKITGMDDCTHNYGSETTSGTTINSTKATAFKNLRGTSGTVTFTAIWEENSATLKYDANGGSLGDLSASVTMKYSTATTVQSGKPTKTGYTFICWNTAADGSGSNYSAGATYKDADVIPTGGTLYAKWSANSYTIAYTLNGGKSGDNAPTSGTYDTALTVTNPKRTGYTFTGWKITGMDTECTHYYGSKSSTTADNISNTKATSFKNLRATSGTVTFTAQWTEKVSKITLDLNGATGTNFVFYLKYNTGYYLDEACTQEITAETYTFAVPTRTGYSFYGYYDKKTNGSFNTQYITSAGGWAVSSSTGTSRLTNTKYSTDTTLYALWKGKVTLKGNGGYMDVTSSDGVTNKKTDTSVSGVPGSKVTLLTPYRDGYTFSGWYTAASGGEFVANGGDQIEAINRKLYAHWTANAYTVVYNKNASDATGTTTSSSHAYGTAKNLTANGFSRTGYTFAGWNTQADGKGTPYTNGQSVTNLATANGATVNLYAQWTENTYTVVYNKNADSATGTTASSSHTYGTAKNLTANGFSRTGYTFAGWATTADGDVVYADKASVTNLATTNGATVNLYAKWAAKVTFSGTNCSVTAKVDGKSINSGDNVICGKTVVFTITANTGYSVSKTSDEVTVSAAVSKTYTATAKEYTVTLNNQSATTAGTASFVIKYNTGIYTNSGTTLSKITVPTKTGYTFGGYYTAANGAGTQMFDSSGNKTSNLTNTCVTSATTWYAKWTANSYTVVYYKNANSATGTTADSTHTYGTAKKLTANGYSRTGYTFAGWATTETGAVAYKDEVSVTNLTSTQNGTVKLYAVWTPNVYTITLVPNGGKGNDFKFYLKYDTGYFSDAECKTQITPDNYTFPVLTRDNYTFDGYREGPKAGTQYITYLGKWRYNANSILNLSNTAFSTDKTLYAHWKGKVTLNGNDGLVNGKTSDYVEGVAGDKVTLPTPTRDGYTFSGWYTAASGGDFVANGGAQIDVMNRTLYAHWTANSYKVKFNGNGSTGGNMSDQTMTYNTAANLTANSFSRTGYTFAGWNTKADGSGTSYANSASVKNLTSTKDGTFNLYAKWTANSYTVVFNGNGNTGGSMSNLSMTYDTAKNLTANGFSRTGYTFAGWATSESGDVVYADKASVNNLTSTKDGTFNLYAKWTANSYSITYNLDGGTAGTAGATSYTIETSALSLQGTPTKTGYDFKGWKVTSAATAGNAFKSGTVYTSTSVSGVAGTYGNVTLTAQWQIKKCKVTIKSRGGEDKGKCTVYFTNYDTMKSDSITISFNDSNDGQVLATIYVPYGTYIYHDNWSNYPDMDKNRPTFDGDLFKSGESNKKKVESEEVTIKFKSSSCLVDGTMITMADGTQKNISEVKSGDMVMTFNHFTGEFEASVVTFNDHAELEAECYNILVLKFDNGNKLEIQGTHGIYDATLMQYVNIDIDNCEQFIGHEFVTVCIENGEYSNEKTVLQEAYCEKRVTKVYSPMTFSNLNIIANGMLTVAPIPDGSLIVNYTDYNDDFTYNQETLANDIATYGLYTPEEWEGVLDGVMFDAMGTAYTKILVGKGIVTEEQLFNAAKYLLDSSLIPET